MSFKVEVWGNFACFTRPEFKAERVSYDIITPSAAVGLLRSIYWHPGLEYHIDKIYVLNPIRFTNIRRNEIGYVPKASLLRTALAQGKPIAHYAAEDRVQRASMILKDVHYVIEFHFTMTQKANPGDNLQKFGAIIQRRLRKGQCFNQPCFGIKEFAANFKEWEGDDIPSIPVTKELGFMLHSVDYSNMENVKPRFFIANMVNGVVDVSNSEVFA